MPMIKKSNIKAQIASLIRTDPKIKDILSKYAHNPEMMAEAVDFVMDDLVDELSPFKHEPVDPLTFIEDGYYCGTNKDTGEVGPASTMYPLLKKDFVAVHSAESDIQEVILTGGIGIGKSFFMEMGLIWNIYWLSCLKDPASYFGKAPGSKFICMVISITEKQAKKNVYGTIKDMIPLIPYFKENFMFDPKSTTDALIFPNGIELLNGTSAQSATIGLNIYSACLDEANFFKVIQKSKRNQAQDGVYNEALILYNSLLRRQDSRFIGEGVAPGILYVGSSRVYPNDFTEQRIKLAKDAGDKKTYVVDYNLWSVNRSKYSKEEFLLEVGGLNRRSRILTGQENDVKGQVIGVPMDFYTKFKKDIDNALREIAGIAVYSVQPFFGQREKIQEMFDMDADRVFSVDKASLSPKVEHQLTEKVLMRQIPNVNRPRYVGIDLAVKKDRAGLAMGYIESMEFITREFYNDETGEFEKVTERMPKIVIEMVLQVYPESEFGEIEFSRIRALLFQLKKVGYRIKYVSADGFQSVDMKQILTRKGMLFDYISMDKTNEPYETFRSAVYDGRVKCIYHSILEEEMAQLERNFVTGKIDHNNQFTKDLSDATGQVVHHCHMMRDFQDEAMLGKSLSYVDIGNSIPDAVKTVEDELKEFDEWAKL